MERILRPAVFIAVIHFLLVAPLQAQYTYHCGGSLMHFHGVNGYVDAQDPDPEPTGITLAAWVRCEVKNPANMAIVYRMFDAYQQIWTTVQYGLVINSSGQFMFQAMIDTSLSHQNSVVTEHNTRGQLDSLASGVVPDSGKYYHIAVTLDPNSFLCNFYVNGAVVASKTMKGALHWALDQLNPNNQGNENEFDASIGAETYYIFNGQVYTSMYFNGYIDDVVESGSVLSKSQLDIIAAGNDLPSGTYMNYHFSEGSGTATTSNPTTVYNSINYGNIGDLYGDYAWATCSISKPLAQPGANMVVTMPKTDTILNGSASYATAPGATISTYSWQQLSGPSTAVMANPNSAITAINSLQIGAYSFQLTVTDNEGNSGTATVQVVVQRAWATVQDSAALADLYKDANGVNWFTGWTLTQPVMKWNGVSITLDSGRVTSVLLGTNNLKGTIPATIVNLTDLKTLNIGNNKLTFSGMEPLAQKFGSFAVYSPQDSFNLRIDPVQGVLYADTASGTVGVNTYQWYEDGVLDTTIVGNPAYTPEDNAQYNVVVTNAVATQLVLYSRKISFDPDPAYINIGGLRVYADNIPRGSVNPRTVSGNVRVVPLNGCTGNTGGLHFSGNVSVDTVLNTLSGNSQIYCTNVGTRGNVNLPYYNNYTFNVRNDVLTWNISDLSTAVFQSYFSLAFLNVEVDSIQVKCAGVQISGELSLPKWIYYVNKNLKSKTNFVKIDNLLIDTGGIKYSGTVAVSGLTYMGVWGFDKLKLTYDNINDKFSVSARFLAKMFNLDGGATIKNSTLDEVSFGIAAGVTSIPLPNLYGFAVDSAGGSIKNMADSTKAREWTVGVRISPYVPGASFPNFSNLKLTGTYQCGLKFSGKAEFSLLNDPVSDGEASYEPGIATLKGSVNFDFHEILKLKGEAEVSIFTNPTSDWLKGTSQLTAELAEISDPWLSFLNAFYYKVRFTARNYITGTYLAGAAKLGDDLPRLFYIVNAQGGWVPQFSTNIKSLPVAAQSVLNLGMHAPVAKQKGTPIVLGNAGTAASAKTYSFSVNSPTENIIVSARGAAPPSLSMYLTNGDSLTALNRLSHKNVVYTADTPNGISTYIIANPPQGIYYAWSPDADSLHVSQVMLPPQILISKVVNDPVLKKLTVTFNASAENNNAFVLFGLDDDLSNADGIVLRDSVPLNGSTGSITLDYSTAPTGVYYLYAVITDAINQGGHYYYNQPFKVLANAALGAPSGLRVNPTDSSLIFNFSPPGPGWYTYLIHYQSDTGQVSLNSPDLAIGDSNAIELTNFPPGKTYQFAVTALDSNNNESDLSNTATISWRSPTINNIPSFHPVNNPYTVQAGATFSTVLSATDPDGDPLAYSLISGPGNVQLGGSGSIVWATSDSDAGYNQIAVRVSDGRGGKDSVSLTVLVYNPGMATPSVSFNQPSFASYSETATVGVSDLMRGTQNNVYLRIYSTSDPSGIRIPAAKISDNASSFLANITLSATASNGNSIRVNKGDTVWAQYTDTASGQSALNYALFSYLKADFLFSDSICISDTAKFYSASKGANLSYSWDFGDGGTSNATNPVHHFVVTNQPGAYKVSLTITNSVGQTDTISKTFHISPSPVVGLTAAGPLTICSGDTLVLSVSDKTDTLTWYHNNALLPGISAPQLNIYTVAASGSYYVNADNSSGCSAKSSVISVVVNPLPPTPSITQRGDSLISNSAAGNQWFLNDTAIVGATGPIYRPLVPGSYSVAVTQNGCSSPPSESILYTNQIISLAIKGDSATCLGERTYVLENARGGQIAWSVTAGNTLKAADSTAIVTWTVAGSETLTAEVLVNGNIVASTSLAVDVTASNPAQPLISEGNGVLQSDAPAGNQWYFNDTLIRVATGRSWLPADSGNYTVQVTVNGCSSPMSAPYHFVSPADSSGPIIRVYPNPASSRVIIVNRSRNAYTAQLFDMAGNKGESVAHARGDQGMNVSSLANGVYILLITDEVTRVQIRIKILKLK
jgi:hypothetical protein